MRGKAQGVSAQQVMVDGVDSIAESLSSAHLLHFPCDETAGSSLVDAVNGATLDHNDTQPLIFSGNAVQFQQGTQVLNGNVLENGYTGGTLVYYAAVEPYDDSNIPTGSYTKCSLSHVSAFCDSGIDIQRSKVGVTNVTTVGMTEALSYDTVVRRRGWQLNLKDSSPHDMLAPNSFSFAIAIKIGSEQYPRMAFSDGKVYKQPSEFTPTNLVNVEGAIQSFDLSANKPNVGYPVPSTNEFQALTPIFRHVYLYAFGAYFFTDFYPSDEELVSCTRWLDDNAKNGNKQAYPLWADKT